MKILVISDLHLFDSRHEEVLEEKRLAALAGFINCSGIDAVLNLGDTVSRPPFLRETIPSMEKGFEHYLKWREQFSIPFAECAITRELGFFSEIMGQSPDSVADLTSDATVITMTPREGVGHNFTRQQLDFLKEALECRKGKTIVIGTHVPFPGSCSREEKPGIFLEIPPDFREYLYSFPGKIIWCGGHFHWDQETPAKTGSLTALYASRFKLQVRGDFSYTSVIDTESGDITFDFHDF